ncbi:bifunctional 4-hydroxy-2-oxoglutarate aldolase/2-dehydro-3-deoxy-phosphogluconate aldolase [Flavobacterium sp. A45]|uniref:bifunctional 4-hydroxy-2-oxoglutarate aldolase/2-dehydro-3-deoxy-phosphogluconate aldolase n=1 Tax=Flavobacterium sp. A45 TaxID=1945862 RepID=UPI0009C4C492|nr:bifunctional 4-hydroxy-2-oxoglutarate aldolase/2-dehydro-3-deoxy-phosphogluconate aldolase [Flavobacterium sp. A45]OOG78153.1 bifunctional 4-hydroxy-2-oxoglutarate aldolase/2-dehydro-3-deoxy-phosphogluconate aldolase [Flavobacterium sp. A45]
MMKKTKSAVSEILLNAGMIPVFYNGDDVLSIEVLQACYNGGIKAFEFTNRGPNALTVFQSLRKYIDENKLDILLGAGTILNVDTANDFANAGADFLVSPILNEKIAVYANDNELYWIPGCSTLTEIANAEDLGAEIIKVFPGSVLGPDFISAVKGPMPWLKLMPTGGVELNEKNLAAWYKAGVVCVGIGSQLITKVILEQRDFQALEMTIKLTLEIIKTYKK